MSFRYRDISNEVGFSGYLPYPPKERIQSLFNRLCQNPTIKDFKEALRIFRFAPEARTAAEVEIIGMLNTGLILARNHLYHAQPAWSFKDFFQHQFYRIIPSLTVFHVLRIIVSNNHYGLF